MKREWIVEDNQKVFKPIGVDSAAVYHTLKGYGTNDPEIFSAVFETLKQCIADEVIR